MFLFLSTSPPPLLPPLSLSLLTSNTVHTCTVCVSYEQVRDFVSALIQAHMNLYSIALENLYFSGLKLLLQHGIHGNSVLPILLQL